MMRIIGWTALLTASGVVLWFVPAPVSNISVENVSTWFGTAYPDQVAVVMVRFVAALWWLRAVSTSTYLLVAVMANAPDHIDNAVAKLPTIGRRLVRPIAVGVIVSSLVTAAPVVAQESPNTPEPTTSTSIEPDPAPPTSTPPGLVMTRLHDTGWPDYTYPTTASDLDPSVATAEEASNSTAVDETWIVVRGDHLWSIAQRTAPAYASLSQVGQHWLAIIELNRSNLPDPNNPDLIYPGDVIKVPALVAQPSSDENTS